MKKKIICSVVLLSLTGCTVTYDLEISQKGFKENITINSTSISENDLIEEYPVNAYYDGIENESNPMEKIEGQEYYDSSIKIGDKNLKSINYSYLFSKENFSKANSIATTFENFIIRQYDHDEDGEKDYILISSGNDFNRFENNDSLEQVTINIHCLYEVISSNADKVSGNIYTWNLTSNNIKAINMVYNPAVVMDERTFWQKLIAGDYFNMFTLSIIILIISYIVFICFKKYSEKVDEI